MKIRPATEADLLHWFPGGVPLTMRTMVLEHDGQLLAVGGVARQIGFHEAFSRVEPAARLIPGARIALGRWAAKVADLIDATPGEVLAEQDPNEPTSPRLLAWCGFVRQANGQWRLARSAS